MTVAITKEQLFGVVTRAGVDVQHGIFKVAYTDNYATGGETIDLSPYYSEVFFVSVESTEDACGYLFYVDDSNFGLTASNPAEIKILLYVPTAPHSHTMYAHGHDLAFVNAAGGGDAVTLNATPQLESSGGAETDSTTVQDTTSVMQDSTATAASEYTNAAAYPANLAIRIRVEGV